jgi:serine/threonine protein kinase
VSTPTEVALAFCTANGHKFIGHVGAGAFKETFHVILATGEPQALKVYQSGFSPERTDRELAAMQRCSHPNIGRLTSFAGFSFEGVQHLLSVEEFLSGGTLTSRLQRGLLNATETLGLGVQLVEAVAHIASRELVHRDIKPDNILYRADGMTPVIVDFGLVRDLIRTSLTQSWLIRGPGTPLYAPPEQLRNEKALIDWRSDQFSLGVVLAFAAFGFHPYQDDGDSFAVTVEHVADRRKQCARFVDAATQSGMPFLIRMTAPWPVERFRTPETLLRAWGR